MTWVRRGLLDVGAFEKDLGDVEISSGTTPRSFSARFSDVANVKDYGASGSAQTTTGSITVGTYRLTVASAIDFVIDQGISIAGAGSAGALLVAKIDDVTGNVITLSTPALTGVSGAAVKHDDTAAIQLAIDAPGGYGGPVLLPVGTFSVTSQLTPRRSTQFIGSGMGFVNSSGATQGQATLIDATGLSDASVINYSAASGARISNLAILGPPSPGINSRLIQLSSAREVLIDHVQLIGGYYGLWSSASNKLTLVALNTELQANAGLILDQTGSVSVFGGQFSNVSGTGSNSGNIVLTTSNDVNFFQPTVDEAFNSAHSILVLGGARVRFYGARVFYAHGGYGIRLGNGASNPTDCVLSDVRVEPFSAGVAPTAAILLRGSGHVLRNVVADVAVDGGATALSDLATDTKMYGVTSITNGPVTTYVALRDPSLPTASPGAGSKQFWYDAAAANAVKFAP